MISIEQLTANWMITAPDGSDVRLCHYQDEVTKKSPVVELSALAMNRDPFSRS